MTMPPSIYTGQGLLPSDATGGGEPDSDTGLRPFGLSFGGVDAATRAMSTSTPQKPENLPSTPSATVREQSEDLALVRDCMGGTRAIKAKKSVYLPRSPGEDDLNYAVRVKRSRFFNAFKHTVTGLVGQIFRKDPVLSKDVPKVIVAHAENIDLEGTHLDVFLADLEQDALIAGHAALLVEFPSTDGTQRRSAELGPDAPIRPYWVPIKKDDIVSWRTENENGRLVLTQLVIREEGMVPSGAFGERKETLYRCFYRRGAIIDSTGAVVVAPSVGYLLLEVTKDRRVIRRGAGDYPTQEEIPVVEIATSGRTALFESAPPLIDLAYLNIAHYQMDSDYRTSIHKTCVPIWVETGIDPPQRDQDGKITQEPVILGPNTARRFINPQAQARYESHDGQALNAVRQALEDMKQEMGTLGLAMLAPDKRGAETAEAHRIDKADEDSALAKTARGLQDGVERALGFHARYMGEASGGSCEINREFNEQEMQAEMLVAWTGAVSQAKVPVRFMLKDMQVGGLISEEEDVEEIDREIQDAIEAEAAAAAEQRGAEIALAQARAQSLGNAGEMMRNRGNGGNGNGDGEKGGPTMDEEDGE